MSTRELIEFVNELAEEDVLAEEEEISEALQRIAEYSVFHNEI